MDEGHATQVMAEQDSGERFLRGQDYGMLVHRLF